MRDLQNQVNFYDPYIDRVVLFDPTGIERSAYPELSSGIGANAASSTWYTALNAGSPWFVSSVTERTAIPQLNIISIATPIASQGSIKGFLVLQIPTSRFLEFGESASLGNYGFVYIVDSKGNIIAHPKFSTNNGPINIISWPVVADAFQNKEGEELTADQQDGQESIVTYHSVPTYGWKVSTQESYSDAFATRDNILSSLGWEIALASVINILIAYCVFLFLSKDDGKTGGDKASAEEKIMGSHRRASKRGGFTLIELLVVIAILAILSIVVILTLNPAGLLQEARDSSRISDLGLLKNAVSLYLADVPSGNLASSSLGYSSCYLSTVSGNGTTTTKCGTFTNTYTTNGSTTGANYKKNDSTGWIPVNFSQISFGTPLATLPVDPVNNLNYYYSYAATTTPVGYFEIDAFMESKKYSAGAATIS